ncbi:hypothetical protein KXX57_005734 [Aspergillus fumigatus]|nr:hypothetical protein KXX57_005734 [Aspergillus fumigatus]KAH2652267.1 hypothetical protein KXV32_004146 [Aspergillus fumigatus]KAH2907140.1 hypothetical protein KXW25_005982 [Aspergillus fumigatus]KAH3008227.1 hypothetical protein KXW60_002316 [Aspergillus fumigatus]KAH3270260.1 hypothetical protein KXW55_002695 [Aspergillus fumigatus]
MGDSASHFLLPDARAARWNRHLMLEFQAALEKNPTADLMSMFPEQYLHEHRKARYRQLSYAANINYRVLDELYDTLRYEPEVDLLSAFPKNYSRKIKMALGPKFVQGIEQENETNGPPEFRTRLDLAESATVVYPLSEEVNALLSHCPRRWLDNESINAEKSFVLSLKQLLWRSPKLWESPVRGVVVKCNEDIVAKVVAGNNDYTEYTSMQYLLEWAPDIPAPRPHGLVAFGPFRVIFMSYIPGTTLTQAWPNLLHEEKLSIQRQLDEIFRRLRALRQDDGDVLGGVCGEGVKELRVDECALFKGITTTKGFNDLQFSARHHGSDTYIQLLRNFLEHDTCTLEHGSVFTHGDVRTDNIMVKHDPGSSDQYVVTGIIDWEDSGFYPLYYECTALTRTLSLVEEDDWYLYLPESISPLKFPVRWLVDRLWQIHLKTA